MKKVAILIIVCVIALSGCGLVSTSISPSGGSDTPPFKGVEDDPTDTALEWGTILAGAIPGVGIGIASILTGVRKVRKARQRQFNAQVDLTAAKCRSREQVQESETIIADLVGNIEAIKNEANEYGELPTTVQEILKNQTPATQAAVARAKGYSGSPPSESSLSSPSFSPEGTPDGPHQV